MYKLFLCLRYLRSRAIAYIAVMGVALSVMLLVITVSVMNGFLDKIEHAAKGLFGDIVIDAPSQDGVAYYDELIAAIKKDVPEVQAGSPFIISYAVLQVPYQQAVRNLIQVAGIRLPERTGVSDFAKGLYVQQGGAAPTFDPPVELMVRRVGEAVGATRKIYDREDLVVDKAGRHSPAQEDLLRNLKTALDFQQEGADNLHFAAENRRHLQFLEEQKTKADDEGDKDLSKRLKDQIDHLQVRTPEAAEDHVILGLGIPGLSIRTDKGETVRILGPGSNIVLNVFPLGRPGGSSMGMTPNNRRFTIVDDCFTDVQSIDTNIVYVPFDTLQRLNNMDEPNTRCSQIHLKVAPGVANEGQLQAVAKKVRDVVAEFRKRNPDLARRLEVLTWRQRQEGIIAPIEAQRTLVVIMIGVSAIVCLVLIISIFYIIVFQKTREIGVMKAVGASGWGVASIFLGYGAAVGLIGAAIGTLLGQQFVKHINPIRDWVKEVFGLNPWSAKSYMFEKIPNTVDWGSVALIVVGAIAAGLLGALVPSIRAARMQPVEALRYE